MVQYQIHKKLKLSEIVHILLKNYFKTYLI